MPFVRGGDRFARWLYMAGLMLGGESIYMLPYMRKTFQTNIEDVFGVTGAQFGTLNGMFGVLAVLSYFPGGWLADSLPARHLLTFSLVTTSLGGFVLMSFPGYEGLLALHALWGVTTILTFWAALIKATREWGGADEQGRGFGLLDGGRGAVAALLASVATYMFTLGDSPESKLRGVLWVYSLAPLLAGMVVWFVVPTRWRVEQGPGDDETRRGGPVDADAATAGGKRTRDAATRTGETLGGRAVGNMDERTGGTSRLKRALRRPDVWLLAAVIFAAYWLYVGSFAFPAYAERAYGRTPTFGAVLATFRDWLRPLAAIGAGFLADKLRSSRVVSGAFLVLVLSFASLWWIPPSAAGIPLLWAQVTATALAVFALRGIYYALMEESHIPRTLTGTTVGFVSMIGFLPDIFAFILSGWFTQNTSGGAGYQSYFGLLAAVALLGFVATALIDIRHHGETPSVRL